MPRGRPKGISTATIASTRTITNEQLRNLTPDQINLALERYGFELRGNYRVEELESTGKHTMARGA
jgi:hypothetical protein